MDNRPGCKISNPSGSNDRRLRWRQSLKPYLKPFILATFKRFDFWRPSPPPILVYHSLDHSGSRLSLSPRQFKEQMVYLKQNGYTTLTLNQYGRILTQPANFPPRAVVLTFDDCFHNLYSKAFPLLQELSFTATAFIPVNFVGRTSEFSARNRLDRILDWPDIKEMSRIGWEFGSHTLSHPHLTGLSPEPARKEIVLSKKIIEDKLSLNVSSFCYPFGEFNRVVKEMVAQSGYRAAVSLRPGYNFIHRDRYCLQRIVIPPDCDLPYFRMALGLLYPFYHRFFQIKQLKK